MKSISQVLGDYAAYHRHPLNRMTHYFGIPLIIFSILLLLSKAGFSFVGIYITAADVLVIIVMAWYFRLDIPLALLTLIFLLPALVTAETAASSLANHAVNGLFAFTFIFGWILQLLGHRIEKRRPALVDNFMQVFSAPLFLTSELAFAFGLRKSLARQVDNIAQEQARKLASE